MNCSQALDRLDDFVDGTLPSGETAEVARHLSVCAACREEERGLRSLLEEAAALPREIEPPLNLWDRIAFRLDRSATFVRMPETLRARLLSSLRPRAFPPPRLAAAAVLLTAGAAFAMMLMISQRAPEPAAAPAAAIAPLPAAVPDVVPADSTGAAAPAGLKAAEITFFEARRQLRSALLERQDSLSPETVRAVDENLRIIEDAIVQIQGALARDPGNRRLEKMLVATRQREVALLRQVTQTAALRQR